MIRLIVSGHHNELDADQREMLVEHLKHDFLMYRKVQNSKTRSPMSDESKIEQLVKYIQAEMHVKVELVKMGSLIIIVQCPTLESLEKLWKSYCSGYLNDIVERFLVTDELRRKLGLDNVRLTTTIEEENYLICKKAFRKTSGELGSLSLRYRRN